MWRLVTSVAVTGCNHVGPSEIRDAQDMPKILGEAAVLKIAEVSLRVVSRDWDYARANHDKIAEHWLRASPANPGYFNGVIHLIERLEMDSHHIQADLIKTDFKSFLYWRDLGFPAEAKVLDGFGSALLRSIEGHILLGRQRRGNINAGLSYLPGGFIDARDVGPDGVIGIRASIAREVFEETGLRPADLFALPGFIVTRTGAQVSIAVEYRSSLSSAQLVAQIHAHLASEVDPELERMVVVRGNEDCRGLTMPPYARVLLAHLFKGL